MELEELKSTWAELDSRLKENKSLSKTIIMEMAQNKVDKLISRFISQERLAVIILILLIPFILFSYHKYGGKLIMWDILVIYNAIICMIYPIWGMYKLSKLTKIDFSKAISDNIRYTNLYNLFAKREKMVVTVFLGPSLVTLGILSYAEARVSIYLWVFLICIFVAVSLLSYWAYKKYNKNMASVMKSLNEIKQLEEEEEAELPVNA